MSKIILLDAQLSNMIAAGEVIERPSSVIKELVENAIDAGATKIEVFLKEGGRTSIEVLDNGSGMNREDALLSLKRHATSKISSAFDLFRIKTLGFRGEALPSIASVSRLTIRTSDGQTVGTEVVADQGRIKVKEAPLKKGTYVKVEDLFFNTPARLKFLKQDAIENASSIEVLSRIALGHPAISFRLTLDGQEQWTTTGRGDLLETIASLYGTMVASSCLPLAIETPDFSLQGFLGKPEIAKSNRYHMVTLINGRSVYVPKLNKAIQDAYAEYLPPTRFPTVFLSLQVDPSLVDVNVHPTKREVRLSKESVILDKVTRGIAGVLQASFLAKTPVTNIAWSQPSGDASIKNSYSPSAETSKANSEISLFEDVSVQDSIAFQTQKSLRVLGQYDRTYILAEDDDHAFYLIDQHAADERINFEKNLKMASEKVLSIEPLIPIVVDLKPSDEKLFTREKSDALKSVGIAFEPFGGHTFKVTQLPLWSQRFDQYAYAMSMLDQVLHQDTLAPNDFRRLAIATRSCKTSIKANERLNADQMQSLLNRLLSCEQPFQCPHGRPTIIRFDLAQVEKWFNRTGF